MRFRDGWGGVLNCVICKIIVYKLNGTKLEIYYFSISYKNLFLNRKKVGILRKETIPVREMGGMVHFCDKSLKVNTFI